MLTKDFITRKQAAEMLGISIPTLDKYTRQGIIPARKLGGITRYEKQIIKELFKPVVPTFATS